MPQRSSPRTTSSALRTAAGLPVCASRKTVRDVPDGAAVELN
ncbi:hypothetical protein BN2537_13513 [Streptomyces venezuelae]|nr:hypothetical protein BN2537_13513 [Streptomyces venezuelae]